MDVIPGFPGVVFDPEILPFHQIPKFPINYLAVQDFLDDPFFLIVYDFWGWGRQNASPDNWVGWGSCQLYHVEDRVKAFHRWGQLESVGAIANSAFDLERAQVH